MGKKRGLAYTVEEKQVFSWLAGWTLELTTVVASFVGEWLMRATADCGRLDTDTVPSPLKKNIKPGDTEMPGLV